MTQMKCQLMVSRGHALKSHHTAAQRCLCSGFCYCCLGGETSHGVEQGEEPLDSIKLAPKQKEEVLSQSSRSRPAPVAYCRDQKTRLGNPGLHIGHLNSKGHFAPCASGLTSNHRSLRKANSAVMAINKVQAQEKKEALETEFFLKETGRKEAKDHTGKENHKS